MDSDPTEILTCKKWQRHWLHEVPGIWRTPSWSLCQRITWPVTWQDGAVRQLVTAVRTGGLVTDQRFCIGFKPQACLWGLLRPEWARGVPKSHDKPQKGSRESFSSCGKLRYPTVWKEVSGMPIHRSIVQIRDRTRFTPCIWLVTWLFETQLPHGLH